MPHDMHPPAPPRLTPEMLLRGYMAGIFPMSESEDDPEVFWVDPKFRGILPLERFHISRSLRREILKERYQIKLNADFVGTVRGCADRSETWINDQIFDAYLQLHLNGFAHSLEVWEGEELVGGVYGVAIKAAFFGESMFSRRPSASKIALAYLISRLRHGGFQLFDTQFVTDHLTSLGAIEVPRATYHDLLTAALEGEASVSRQPLQVSPHEICNG